MIRHRRLSLVTAAAVALLALTASAGPALGQGSITFGIQPAHGSPDDAAKGAYFIYTLQPGQTMKDEATVTSTGTDPVTLKLYAADAITATGGGTAFASATENVNGDRSFLVVPNAPIVLAPGQKVTIPFSVTVPADAKPGDHIAGLIVEAPPKAGAGGNVQTTVVERVGVAVVVRVPGKLTQQLTMGEFCLNQQSGSNYFQIPVDNTGNVLAKGTGKFKLETEKGDSVFERNVDLGSVMPGGKTVIRVHAPQDPPPGKYVARVFVEMADGARADGESKVTVPKTKANGCGLEIDDPNVKLPNEGANDNFNVPGVGSVGGGSSVMVLGLLGVVLILCGLLIVVVLKSRGPRRAG